MADAKSSTAGKTKKDTENWYRFSGFYPASYTDKQNVGRWIVPGEVVAWDTPPDGNWALVELEKDAFPSKDLYPSAGVLPETAAETKADGSPNS